MRAMEAVARFSKEEAERLVARAKTAQNKSLQTKSMVLFFLESRNLAKVEGRTFTLRRQKNSVDSVRLIDEAAVPMKYKRIEAQIDGAIWEQLLSLVSEEQRQLLEKCVVATSVVNDAIKIAVAHDEQVPGAQVYRGSHVRIA
jgi:hypothetical protein